MSLQTRKLILLFQAYKRKDPGDEDETEMVENFFNALCSMLNEPEIKQQFLEAEGVELMLIMLRLVLIVGSSRNEAD